MRRMNIVRERANSYINVVGIAWDILLYDKLCYVRVHKNIQD